MNNFKYIFIFVSLFLLNPGTIAQNAVDANGLKTGPWKGYYPDGGLRYEASFVKGKPLGEMKRYDEEGKLAMIMNFYPGGDRCNVEMYYPKGQVKASGVYDHQQKDSTWTYFSTDGTVMLTEIYENGILQNKSESFYPTGSVSRLVYYHDGMKDGLWLQFFENGDTMTIAHYEKDILDGPYRSYYPEGLLQIEGNYYHDLKDGDWLYYSEEGDTMTVLKYDKGAILNPDVLEESYEKFIKNIEENLGNSPDPALQGGGM